MRLGCVLRRKKWKNKKRTFVLKILSYAVRMGLEPMTSAVTGRHSNQLN